MNATLANFRNLEKARLSRAKAGINLDEEYGPPYQEPKFDTIHKPDPRSEVEAQVAKRNEPVPEVRPSLPPIAERQNEPKRTLKIEPIPKRPAA